MASSGSTDSSLRHWSSMDHMATFAKRRALSYVASAVGFEPKLTPWKGRRTLRLTFTAKFRHSALAQPSPRAERDLERQARPLPLKNRPTLSPNRHFEVARRSVGLATPDTQVQM
jgi:hypothetical protein